MKKSFQCLVLALSAAAGTPSGTAGPAFFYRETESIATHSPRRIIIASTDVDRVMAFDGNAKAVKAVNAAVSIDGKSIYIPETQGHPFVGITCWADDAMWVDLDAGTLSVRNGKIVADPSADSDMEISFEGEAAVITFRGHPGKKVQYDIDNGCFVLTDRDMGGICIFQEDIYMADFADGHTPPRKEGDPVRLSFSGDNSYCSGEFHYIINDGTPLRPDEVVSEGRTVSVPTSAGDVVLPYYGSGNTLWAVPVVTQFAGAFRNSLFTADLSRPVLEEGEGVFVHPTEDPDEGAAIDFRRGSGVRIIYTLDGTDPADAGTASRSEESVYDLDRTPIVFNNEELTVVYRAVKAGYAPSEPRTLEISAEGRIPTSLDTAPADGCTEEPEYYDLRGVRIHTPPLPGIYIRRQGAKTSKIVVR